MASIDGYLALCQEFPLHVLHTPDDCIAAMTVLDRLHATPRSQLGDSQRMYMETLEVLVIEYRRGFEAFLCNNGNPDSKVLKYLMAVYHPRYPTTPDGIVKLAMAINIPTANLKAVFDGKDELCRESVCKLAAHFKVPISIFDHSYKVGRDTSKRRFRVLGGAGNYVIADEQTKAEAHAGSGGNSVAVGDIHTDTFFLNPEGMGFREEWEYQLNCETDLTIEVFFPKLHQKQQERKKAEMKAVRELNRGRRMFYILDHTNLPDGEELVVAEKGDDRVHEDWFNALDVSHRMGWDAHVRGAYYPSANLLMFYIGEEHHYTDQVQSTAIRWLKRVVEQLEIPGTTKLGLGTIKGEPGTVWKPQREWGFVSSRLADLELCA